MLDITSAGSAQSAARLGWTGLVRFLHLAPRAFLPMRAMESITLVAGRGIEGDRYMIGNEEGFYSHKPEEGRQVTLFELETLVALKRDAGIELGPRRVLTAVVSPWRGGRSRCRAFTLGAPIGRYPWFDAAANPAHAGLCDICGCLWKT